MEKFAYCIVKERMDRTMKHPALEELNALGEKGWRVVSVEHAEEEHADGRIQMRIFWMERKIA